MTVNGGQRLFSDIFTSGISQWTTVQGTGFYAYGGQLINDNTTSGDKILVSNSTITNSDFIINVNVKNVTSASDNASIIFRYQNTSNYYMVVPTNNTLSIYKCYNGTLSLMAQGSKSAIQTGTWYGLRIEVKAGQISAYWNNSHLAVVSWTDPTPLAAGKVGCRKSTGYVVNWDNFYVWSDGNGSVLSYNDSYPFGLTMPNRSLSYSPVDGRYRFTGKELDAAETGLFYFGKRYYDGFIARWWQVDPLLEKYPGVSTYNYCLNNPICSIDPQGHMRQVKVSGC
jgi:RHS repeat-associated protein